MPQRAPVDLRAPVRDTESPVRDFRNQPEQDLRRHLAVRTLRMRPRGSGHALFEGARLTVRHSA